MPATPNSLRRPCGVVGCDALRTYLAFAVLAFGNAILPFVVFSAAYLIIPYSRPVVVLVETLPALVTKLLFPHLLRYVPYWARPLLAAVLWIAAGVASVATPPNVDPFLRILIVMLASGTAAATDVSLLGLLRWYGTPGLAGWGLGTSSGAAMCAVLPYVMTERLGRLLRSSVDSMYYLLPIMLVVCFVLLPRAAMRNRGGRDKRDLEDPDSDEEDASLLIQEPQAPAQGFSARMRSNIWVTGCLVRPYMLPLFLALTTQVIVFPGTTRALAIAPAFDTFASFSAAFGLALQTGNLVSRSSILVFRVRRTRLLMSLLSVGTVIALANAALLFIPIALGTLLVAFYVGLISGAIYINTFAAALEDGGREISSDREFSLGVIGSGEAAGILLGGLVGALLETELCKLWLAYGHRWCHRTR